MFLTVGGGERERGAFAGLVGDLWEVRVGLESKGGWLTESERK